MALFSVPPEQAASVHVRVAVVAELGLVAESVRAALVTKGYNVVVVRWPIAEERAAPRRLRPRRRVGAPPDVALMLSDLDRIPVVRDAQILVSSLDVPWLVLTGASRGPAWGALYESGADLVVSANTRLDLTCQLLEDLAGGRTPRSGRRRRQELIRTWRTFARQRDELTERLQKLTEREEQVLQLLYAGMAVRAIADDSQVTESTVRSQVKAILRKLEVSSQLAAVAVYEEIQTDSTESDSSVSL